MQWQLQSLCSPSAKRHTTLPLPTVCQSLYSGRGTVAALQHWTAHDVMEDGSICLVTVRQAITLNASNGAKHLETAQTHVFL
jgi:hypothetical protein